MVYSSCQSNRRDHTGLRAHACGCHICRRSTCYSLRRMSMNAFLKFVCSAALLTMTLSAATGQSPSSPQAVDCTELKDTLSRAQTRLQDWPQLARYVEANGKTAAPAKGELRVVFMGDSITDFWGRGGGEF